MKTAGLVVCVMVPFCPMRGSFPEYMEKRRDMNTCLCGVESRRRVN